MLSPHLFAALEYGFFKVNTRPIALIVDLIVFRRTQEPWLRASLHSPHRREVLFDKRPALKLSPGLASHYWGRQLAAEWWVSANQFDFQH